ncbi:MAG: PatB family C-S lyase [Chloroflexi bacterium]|nr:PatB family C-S lyase [Chloroflexota bacterium]
MNYDFDLILPRRGTDSVKWNRHEADVLPLWVADLDFASPQPVIEALARRVEHGVFGYGIEPPLLREVVRELLRQRYDWQVANEDLVLLPGVVPGLNLVALACSEPGDGLLVQPPIYPPFLAVEKNIGRTVETAPLVLRSGRYEVDPNELERALTARTRVFLLCNPHNPSGRVFTRAELEQVAEVCLRHNLVLCSDEIHQDFIYEGHTHIPIASLAPEIAARTVTLLSPSKTYNIAGFHLAVAVVNNPELRAKLNAASAGILPRKPGVLDIVAALAAYQHGGEWLGQLLAYLKANRDLLVGYVGEDRLPGVTMGRPEGTYLGWLDCRAAGIQGSAMEFFLREARVALGEGADFGAAGEGFVRLNFGCPRSALLDALERMRQALERNARLG